MKKIFLLFVLTVSMISCNNSEEKKTEVTNEELKMFTGEFLYLADAAVLKGNDYIYGVTLDEVSKELANKVKPVKTNDFDMVMVIVKGVVKEKPEGAEGWDEIITIKEIVKVGDKPSPADVKIEEKKS